VDRYNCPKPDVVVVAEYNLLVTILLAVIEKFHDLPPWVSCSGVQTAAPGLGPWAPDNEKFFRIKF
jgi:hypothetical protein